MKKTYKWIVSALVLCAVAMAIFMYIKGRSIAIFDPKGPIGLKEKNLILTTFELMLIVVIPVLILALVFAWRYREGNTKAKHTPNWEHNTIAEYCWWGVPLFIIMFLAVFAYKSSHELDPFSPIKSDKKTLTIQVVALQWKWLFLYPEQGLATVNYVQFPVSTPIHFEITSDAPMNSFWIPQLAGQIYAMPAMRSQLYLLADEVGSYRGLSANISGSGFAGMTFTAKACSDADFQQWVDGARGSAALSRKEYDVLAVPSENNKEQTFTLADRNLFDQVMMKYLAPAVNTSDQKILEGGK